ncbi:MAG: hypothetical protein ACQEP7_01705, partial [bacterium]
DVYFGDSDSDITDGRKAGITAVRIQRSDKSNYDKKYNPGNYDEIIIESTTEHDCTFEPWKTSARKVNNQLFPRAA